MNWLMKLLYIILLCIMLGGCAKPIDEIYIYGNKSSIFDRKGIDGWSKAIVLEKDGDMWRIVAEGTEFWFDTTDPAYQWKKTGEVQ